MFSSRGSAQRLPTDNVGFVPLWAKLLHIPRLYLYVGIAVLSMLGVYAIGSSTFD